MLKKLFVGAFAFVVVLAPYGGATVHAASDATVSINSPSLNCGDQSVAFSGTAKFDQVLDHLAVTLDGTQIHYQTGISADAAEAWTAAAVAVGTGSHTLVATVWDQGDETSHSGELATATVEFTVSGCSGGSNGGGDDGGDDGESGPGDQGPDPDPIVEAKKTGKVAGVTVSASDWARLKPLNSIFRSVYGRNPTFAEWTYWANRLLNDKPQYDALYGAMQWHHLRGMSIGK